MTCSFLAYFLLSQLHVADVLDSLSCWERISLAWIDDDNDDADDDADDDNVDDEECWMWSKLGEHGVG